MSKERQRGTELETSTVRAFHAAGYKGAHRNALHGANDIGDIGGVVMNGHELAIECKNEKAYHIGEWLSEAREEQLNAGADAGIVVFHQRGKGFRDVQGMLQQPVLMTLGDLFKIAEGRHTETGDALERIARIIEEARERIEDMEV